MNVELADLASALNAPQRRFSATQAVFQFAALTFLVVVLAGVIVAIGLDGTQPGVGRLLLLASGVSLLLPAAIAARLVFATTAASATPNRSFDRSVKAVVAAIGVSMVLFFSAALAREPQGQKTILDPQRDTARFLFGIDDLANARLVNYSKANDKVEAEFTAAGRKISIVVTPVAAE